MSKKLSRRDFVRITTAAGATVAVTGLLGCGSSQKNGAARAKPSPGPEPGGPAATPAPAAAAASTSPARKSLDAVDPRAIEEFVKGFKGTVVRPTDPAYAKARLMWNTRFDRHPGLIARCKDPSDVARAIDFVRGENALVSVRGGGHSIGGYSVCDGGLVINLSALKQLKVNRHKKTVTAAPGVLLGEIENAAAKKGLATVTGQCADVGVGGFTLGGGEGVMTRKYGMACDNLISAQVVLASGKTVTASAKENPDLYWALCGGGGNFGVVTSFECRAFPVNKVLAGDLIYKLPDAAAALTFYREFQAKAPDELFVLARIGALPPKPAVFMFHVVLLDKTKAGMAALKALRAHGKPLADTIRPMTYLASQRLDPTPPQGLSGTRAGFLPSLDDGCVSSLTQICSKGPPMFLTEMVPMDGASSRVPVADTAFSLRQSGFNFMVTSGWRTPEQGPPTQQFIHGVWDAVRPFSKGVYVNQLEDEGDKRVKEAYGANYARLAKLKAQFDPDNMFRSNQNIAPARG